MFGGRRRAYCDGRKVTVPHPMSSDTMLVSSSVDSTVKYQKMDFYFSPGLWFPVQSESNSGINRSSKAQCSGVRVNKSRIFLS
jgi:hypothetical protein